MTVSRLIVGFGVVLVVGGMLTARAEAAESPALSYVGNSIGSAVASDGKRYAAYYVSEGSTRILDEEGRTLRDDVAIPADPWPLFRTVEAVGGGYVLLGSSVAVVPPPKLVEIATGSVLDVDARPWAIRWDNVYLTGVGRHWLGGDGVTSHGGSDTFLNWHTGRVAEPGGNSARATPDLNTAELWRPMCSPLHRRSSRGLGLWRSFQYRPPLGLTTSRAGRLLLLRCGQRKVTTLSRCRKGCGFAQLGGGLVTWREGRRAYFYRAHTRCRRRWVIPAPATYLATVAHTSKRVFISTIDPVSYGKLQPRPVWRIYTAAIPSC
jgi:hypothetical protein